MRKICTLLAAIAVITGCFGQSADSIRLDPVEFNRQINMAPVQLLDVRTLGEYSKGHLAKSLLADWNQRDEFERRVSYLDMAAPVYVYCGIGARSAAAAEWMRGHGFSLVKELDGGVVNWRKAGLPEEAVKEVKQMTMAEYTTMIPSSGLTLVDFGAEWCPPCVRLESSLREISTEFTGRLTLLRVDVGAQTDLLQAMQITSYPTLIVYKNGKETWRNSGLLPKEKIIEQLQ